MIKRSYFPGWNVVIGSSIGIAFGSVPFFAAGFALLASAMARDFGWTQADVAKAASIYLLMQTVAYPLCGPPLDRWGSRNFAVISIALFALSLVILSQIGGSLTELYLAFAFMGFISAGTNVLSYARAIALWFNRKRGFALGVSASSQALGAFLIPVFAEKIIHAYGWSASLIGFAAFEAVVCLPLVLVLIKDSPKPYGLLPDGDTEMTPEVAAEAADPGMAVGEILRTGVFWKLAVCFAVMGMSFYAITPNIVYILTKKAGLSVADIALIQAFSGVARLFGRVGFGYLLDRIHAPYVGILALLLSALCAVV
jgi:sugar phosphate permease